MEVWGTLQQGKKQGNQIVECVYCGQNPNYKGLNQDEIIVHIAFCSVCFPTRSYICQRRKH